MSVLSIQSWVSYGHVGNAAAAFCLQRLGHEVWAVNTVAFSNHPGHGGHAGRIVPADEVAALIDGIAARGVLSEARAILSGYLGEAETGPVLLNAVERVKTASTRALFACDPVIGEEDREGRLRVFVRAGLPEFFRDRALGRADIVTPNRSELAFLTGLPAGTLAEMREAAFGLRERLRPGGPRIVLATGLRTAAAPDTLSTMLVCEAGAFLVGTPYIPFPIHGTGDALAALFLGQLLAGRAAPEAAAHAVSGLYGVIRATAAANAREMLLVAEQGALVEPPRLYPAEPLR